MEDRNLGVAVSKKMIILEAKITNNEDGSKRIEIHYVLVLLVHEVKEFMLLKKN